MPFKYINLRGDLFATGFCFLAQGILRLGSSLVLTRILQPQAYGVITVLMSILFVVEMLADIGITVFIVREPTAEQPRFVNAAWTLRLARALINFLIVFLGAPVLARFYDVPTLEMPLRLFSFWFILSGLESLSFPIAIRRKRSRIVMYSDLVCGCLTTVFTVIYCYFSRSYWGMVYGILLNRLSQTILSYCFYPEFRPKIQFDWAATRTILQYTRFTMPSGLLTLILGQFDKVIFLRLFDIQLLGVYGVAGNMVGALDGFVNNIIHMVLYPRCAHNFRSDRDNFVRKYYSENKKLFVTILLVPAAVGGSAHLIIPLMYDPRYALAAVVLQALTLRTILISFATPSEVLLIAAGESQVILIGSIFRVIWMIGASLLGYHFFGFLGFIYGVALNGVPALAYYLWLQRQKGMLIARYELHKIIFAIGIAVAAYWFSALLLNLGAVQKIRLSFPHSSSLILSMPSKETPNERIFLS